MQTASIRNTSSEARPARKQERDDLRSRLISKISEIPLKKVDDRIRVNNDLKRITSLEIGVPYTATTNGRKPTIDEIIAEMEAEMERLG